MTETRSLRIFALTLPHAEPVEARGSAPYPGFAGTSPRGGGLRTVNLPLYIRVPREGGDPDPFAQVVIDPLALCLRVIARRFAPKQPRGTSTKVRVSPLACFAALAMTRREGSG